MSDIPLGIDTGKTIIEEPQSEAQLKRRDDQRKMTECFQVATRNIGGGGGNSQARGTAGYLDAANYGLLSKDGQGEFATKVGWSDFVPSSTDKNELGPERLKRMGPVYVLSQFDAYMLAPDKIERWEKDTTGYLKEEAQFVVSGDRTYQNLHGRNSPRDIEGVESIDFTDPAVAHLFQPLELEEHLRLMRNKAVAERIGKESFDILMDALPQDIREAQRFLVENYRFYSEFIRFLIIDNPDLSGPQDDYEYKKKIHLQYVQRFNELRSQALQDGQESSVWDVYETEMQALKEVAPEYWQKATVASTLRLVQNMGIENTGIYAGDEKATQSLFDLRQKYDKTSGTFSK